MGLDIDRRTPKQRGRAIALRYLVPVQLFWVFGGIWAWLDFAGPARPATPMDWFMNTAALTSVAACMVCAAHTTGAFCGWASNPPTLWRRIATVAGLGIAYALATVKIGMVLGLALLFAWRYLTL